MDSLTVNNHDVNAVQYSAGIELFRRGKPITSCANSLQRLGWRDARAGERACAIIDAVVAAGGNAINADRAIAGEWR